MGKEIYNTMISYSGLILGIEVLIMMVTLFFIIRLKRQLRKEREEIKQNKENEKEQEFMKQLSNPWERD